MGFAGRGHLFPQDLVDDLGCAALKCSIETATPTLYHLTHHLMPNYSIFGFEVGRLPASKRLKLES